MGNKRYEERREASITRLTADIPALADLFSQAIKHRDAHSRWPKYNELKQQGMPLIEQSSAAPTWPFSIQQALDAFSAELDRLLPPPPVEDLVAEHRRWLRQQEEAYDDF